MKITGIAKHQIDHIQIKYPDFKGNMLTIELPKNGRTIEQYPEGRISLTIG